MNWIMKLPGERKSQPLWWDDDCDKAIGRRRAARRRLLVTQNDEAREEFRVVDNEVKWCLRAKKKKSFASFCESIEPSAGLQAIWSRCRAFSSGSQPLRTGVFNVPDSSFF